MLENEFYISNLIGNKLRGDLNPDQEDELTAWLNSSEKNRILFNELKDAGINKEVEHFTTANKASVWNKTLSGLNQRQFAKPKKLAVKFWPQISIAAALFLAVGFSVFFYINIKNKQTVTGSSYANDIAPGASGATLTLANGKKINLDHTSNGKLANEADVNITKNSNGVLIYTVLPQSSEKKQEGSHAYHTLSTANGQQYQVVLPDQSIVWLNSASSITFPASFEAKNDRTVRLNGEAYFEITKDKKHPFIVKTDKQNIMVLGTHFNVNAYLDDVSTKTTLLEGNVQINNSIILKPAEQAISDAQTTKVKTVNVLEAVAWKQGDFVFKNQELTTSMRQIARWYNVEIIYEAGAPKQLKLGGSISRNNPISVVLNAMEKTGKVKFKITGRRVIVSKV